MNIGYIGSPDENERQKWEEMLENECGKIFHEPLPINNRNMLSIAINELMEGDIFMVGTLADLGVTTTEIMERCFAIKNKKADIEALDSDVAGKNVEELYQYLKERLLERQGNKKEDVKEDGKRSVGRPAQAYVVRQSVLMHLSGMTPKQISEELKIPLSTVYYHISQYKKGAYQDVL